MLTALRRRLTLLMTALTSLVLAGALVVTWNYAAAQYRTAAETLLTQSFSAIVDRLDSADSVSDAWLADQEHNSGCLLFQTFGNKIKKQTKCPQFVDFSPIFGCFVF